MSIVQRYAIGSGAFSFDPDIFILNQLEITVEKTVEFGCDGPSPSDSLKHLSITEPQLEC